MLRSLKRSKLGDEQGFSLTEISVSVGILSIIMLTLAGLMQNLYKNKNEQEIRSNRDQIAKNLRAAIRDFGKHKDAITADTSSGNIKLKSCLTPYNAESASTIDCVAERTSFNFLRMINDQAVPPITEPLAGDGTSKVLYNRNGTLCKTAECDPFFEAIAYFTPVCLNQSSTDNSGNLANSCYSAYGLRIAFQIKTLKPLPSGKSLPPTPLDVDLDNSAYMYETGVNSQSGKCGPNSIPSGQTSGGYIQCRCVPMSIVSGYYSDGNPICTTPNYNQFICGEGKRLLGTDDAGKPICSSGIIECDPTLIDPKNCPNDTYLGFFSLKNCKPDFIADNKPVVIKCTTRQGRCCRER